MSRLLTLLAALLLLIAFVLLLRHDTNNKSPDDDLKSTTTSNSTTAAQGQAGDTNFHQWHEFTSEASNFKVLLPSLPQHVSDTIEDPKTKELRKFDTFALAGNNGAAFVINAITYDTKHEVKADEESFKSAVDDMISRNKDNKVDHLQMGSFKGTPALDFSLNNDSMTIEGKVFAHGNKMYILSMINSADMFKKKEFDFFINSFDFIDDQKNNNSF